MSGSKTPPSGPGEVSCSHCGLPVPADLVEPGAELQFCCNGCRLAYRVIHDAGLDGYYGLRERFEGSAEPAHATGRAYHEFDDPSFQELYVRRTASGLATIDLYLEGVHCAACVWLVEKVPVVVPGVAEVRLDMGRSLARVTWDPENVPLSRVARFLDSIGYPPHPYRGVAAQEMARRQDRALLLRVAVAGAVAGNVMLMAVALYGGHFHGMAEQYRDLFRWASLILTLPSVLWCAQVFYVGTLGALRTRSLHMDIPITLGIWASFLHGAWNTFRGSGEVYFDSVTALIFLLLVGRYLQRRQQRAAADATLLLFSLTPSSARRVEDGEVREVAVESLKPGDVVELLPGDSVPADGVVLSGESTVDRSLLTGESRPEPVAPGDPVHAGTVNLGSPLRMEVRAVGEDTRLGRLMQLVEEASRRRAPVVRLADRLSGHFVAAVLGLAAVTLVIWLFLDPAHAVDHTVALLIVSCPCALGLATPLAVAAAIGHAARRGILIKGGDALEPLARPARMILDKTGTVTEGRMALVEWWGDRGLEPLVAAAEARSSHPVAVALAEAVPEADRPGDVTVEQTTGGGLAAHVAGVELLIGSPAFVERTTGALPAPVAAAVEEAAGRGLTPVVVAAGGVPRAVAGLGDPVRPDSAGAVAELERRGWRVELLSGDHPEVVRAVAAQVGIDPALARGGASPEDKVRAVEEAAAGGTVVMVGDGVNDAAALAVATVGIGVHGGAEAALAAADVYLREPGLTPLLHLVEGASRTLAVIRRHLGFSLAYNAIAISLAMAGLMSPLLAAVLMPASSIVVVVGSYRARTFRER
ncbi:MAG TPA: heavy metal translocating P-type ATPase [Acidobacteria bacterium]|nr:heavy metal translocating P-type ATPase [Acidobacteriota bacterium]